MNEEAVKNWLQKARNDLKIAKDEMATQEPATDMVCFHLHQCCEKHLKAFLIFHGEEYPRSHRLAVLLALCAKVDASFQNVMEWNADQLTRYATALRYAEEFYLPPRDETRQAMELAERVTSFVLDRLRDRGLEP